MTTMSPTDQIHTALGLSDLTRAYSVATKADLAAVAEIILAALPEKPAPAPAVDDDSYHTIAATCRITCVTYDHAKAVLAQQRNLGRIRTTTTGSRIEYHLGDFKRVLAATPYKPRRRRLTP